MMRVLLPSKAFTKAARRLMKKNVLAGPILEATLESLSQDAFQVTLRTHKLKGDLTDCYACSPGCDLRIIFEFVQHEGAEAVLLLTVGTHDEVY